MNDRGTGAGGAAPAATPGSGGGDGPPPSPPGAVPFRLRYNPGFDALRGIAIVMELLYHAWVLDRNVDTFLAGSYQWLEMFFVQSGFLIVVLLVDEHRRTGTIRIRRFYARRALRLFPALWAACATTLLYLVLVAPRDELRPGSHLTAATLLYVNNWWQIATDYTFNKYLGHAWSLSVEEQFYLVAPLLVLFVLRRGWRFSRVAYVALGLAACSAAWMAWIALRTGNTLRTYYGTDTRAQGLLVGLALAFAVSGGLLSGTLRRRRQIRIAGITGAAVGVTLLVVGSADHLSNYYGIFLLGDLAWVALLALLLQEPRGVVGRALDQRPLVYLGERVYGIYVWHLPFYFMAFPLTRHWPFPAALAFQLAGTLVIAELSWRLLERPCLLFAQRRFRRVGPEAPVVTDPAPATT